MLLENKYKLSFSEIGYEAFGTPGKVAVDFFLALTQTIFVGAYITFIVTSINDILVHKFKIAKINEWILGAAGLVIYIPLVFVRKIEKFAFFHIFADIAILVGIVTITIYASIELKDNEGFSDKVKPINEKTFLSFIGLSSYTFEGIGVIIPIMETTSRPDLYPYLFATTLFLLTGFYVFFGNYCYFIYGYDRLNESPLITNILPSKSIPLIIVKIVWIVNLIFTYPLQLHPANMVIESYLYRGWKKGPKRTWIKNFTRSLLVILTIVLSISLLDTLDKLESINGAFAGIPIAFLLPGLFHYKLVAETTTEKFIDLLIVGLAVVLQITCTVVTFLFWND